MNERQINRRRIQRIVVACAGLAGLATAWLVPNALAYERYNMDGQGCIQCHGDFTGPVSPNGTIFPSDDKHSMHRSSSQMDTDCNKCHISNGDDPLIGMSASSGPGCTGCHGRDYGGALGNSGVGLRLHHIINNVTICAGCHPGDPAPLPESIAPFYYGMAGTNVDDPCNAGPAFLENWSVGDTQGLDNDGDNLYDGADPDCGACTGDIDGSGDVGFSDILAVIGAWGPCGASCPADISGNGQVDFADILAVIGAWGPC